MGHSLGGSIGSWVRGAISPVLGCDSLVLGCAIREECVRERMESTIEEESVKNPFLIITPGIAITCRNPVQHDSLLLGSRLGNLGSRWILLLHALDDSDSHSLPHVPDGKTTKWGILGESFNNHGLGGNHLNHSRITILQEFGLLLKLLTRSPVNLGQELSKFDSNVGGVAIEDRGVTISNLTRVVHDDNLGGEVGCLLGRIILGVGGNIPTLEILNSNILNVEANIVTRKSLQESLMMHFNGLNFSGQSSGAKSHNHTRLDQTGLNTTHRDSSNASNLVNILKWETEGLV
ncbi:hypothetical protein CFP56_007868 [Quercus suber]|uniref:Uncharacterized protein n=1 Tax=Quercus suber TaxID=58331 RepID=A0AAW0L6B0_QUESU